MQGPAHQSKMMLLPPNATVCTCSLAQSRGLRRIHELYFISLERAAFY